ncbi:MAG: protein kinase [Gammaproteobacteria bacterium]|nr:protein kinase [Gammaproteobacteria bacterium]
MPRRQDVTEFDLRPGRKLGSRYEVVEFLGRGWEGEVYKVVETATGIERAAKLFFPQRNPRGKALRQYAQKLNKLKHVPVIMQYHHRDTARVRRRVVEFMVSEYVDGEMLSAFLNKQPGKRFTSFEALHILYALASGVEPIHRAGEYHGDLHSDNVIIRQRGIEYEVKLLDFFDLGRPSRQKIHNDVADLVYILYELVGGKKHYRNTGPEIKGLVKGLKFTRIIEQMKTASDVRQEIENVEWSS